MVFDTGVVILVSSIAAFFGLYLIVNLSLNLEFGYTGIPNFGKMLVVLGGAYIAGYLPGRLLLSMAQIDPSLDYIADNALIVTSINSFLRSFPALGIGILLLTILIGAAVGAVLGFVAAYPA
ncbi:MAG TPA: branched-chain amino acid ABC transporter permease, partial [Candidatus Caldiarchaeum subterraneum]|nr:branched-chain amino acid ABC transporter permease [Candidatus Caldarchaeum subterraneum]